MQAHFRILDVGLRLSGPSSVVEPIARAYRRFETAEATRRALDVEVCERGGAFEMRVDDARIPLLAGLDPVAQVYQQLLVRVMREIGSHAVLHAAALVDRSGGAFLLAAPSGHGKTTLALELVRRGFGFLGDDYAPLELDTGRVWPCPRALGVLPREGEDPADGAGETGGARIGGKDLLDVGDLFGDDAVAREPAPLRHVLLLAGRPPAGRPADGVTVVELAARAEHAAELDRQFSETEGVRVIGRAGDDATRRWRLVLDHARHPTGSLATALDSDRILLLEKHWAVRPDFQATPEATEVRRSEAAEQLGRELLNRRRGSRLMQRYDGRVTALFIELACALRPARCWRVTVGQRGATADLIERLVTGDGPGRDATP